MNAITAIALLAAPSIVASLAAQDDLERLVRDQAEVVRKADELRSVMERLIVRFEREGRAEQVKLLKDGLAHLAASGLLDDAATARRDIDREGGPLWEKALRTQQQVLASLERLLDILLEHNSLDDLQNEIDATSELASTARELEQRQAELKRATAAASQTPPSEAERQIQEQLEDLARDQRQAAEDSRLMAGQRLPVLEAALERVQRLLRDQNSLEQGAERQQSGAPDPVKNDLFNLGALQEQLNQLNSELRRAKELDRAAADARNLSRAMKDGDAGTQRDAQSQLERRLNQATTLRSETDTPDPELQSLNAELSRVAKDGDSEKMEELADRIAAAAAEAAEATRKRATASGESAQEELRRQAADLAQRGGQKGAEGSRDGERGADEPSDPTTQGEPSEPTKPAEPTPSDPQQSDPSGNETAENAPRQPGAAKAAKALEEAADRVAKALAAQEGGDPTEAQARVSEAQRAVNQSRKTLREANPEAADRANDMASQANQLAGELQNSESAQDAERDAAKALENAEQALRDAADRLEKQDREGTADPDAAIEQSRANLEAARAELQNALAQASESNEESASAAAERQQGLQQAAQQAQQAMQQAAQNGQLSPEQQQGAQQAMQQAQQAMQQAQQALENNRPAQAAQAQDEAARQVDEARQRLEQGRQMGAEQEQALQDMAAQQEELKEQILRLREMTEERQNREAQEALDRAAEAAEDAERAMEQGDRQEALENQQRAQDALEDAAEALEEERDRYMDLRQEELMFRMKDELEEFLAKQEPITKGTIEIGEAAESTGRVSRPARKRLNRFGETERELASKLEFIREALQEEGNQVFDFVLKSNQEDLSTIADRLAGRAPDPSSYTVMMQQDVERRTRELLGALEDERKRREEERDQQQQQQEQQQQEQGENKFNQQRERLVEIIAELKMLRQLESNAADRIREMEALLRDRSDDITDVEARLIERLANRHNEINRIFKNIKSQMEQALQQASGGNDQENGR